MTQQSQDRKHLHVNLDSDVQVPIHQRLLMLGIGHRSTFKPLTLLSIEHRKENGTVILPFPGFKPHAEFGTYIYYGMLPQTPHAVEH